MLNKELTIGQDILEILLKDNTTKKNIIWATDEYSEIGNGYGFYDEITIEKISDDNAGFIKSRNYKDDSIQQSRVRTKGEVFTPAWVCNMQNNAVDEAWFQYEYDENALDTCTMCVVADNQDYGMFNKAVPGSWEVIEKKVNFPEVGENKEKSWQSYVWQKRLEIACGEAPYLTTRYDAATGEIIDVKNRIGLLDRKLRVIGERVRTHKSWLVWTKRALQSTYGYDWQGDNVLLARKNVLFTVMEHYAYKYEKELAKTYIIEFAKIISWNIWQMDGIRFVLPKSCHDVWADEDKLEDCMPDLFGSTKEKHKKLVPCPGCKNNDSTKHSGVYCKIKDWPNRRIISMLEVIKND